MYMYIKYNMNRYTRVIALAMNIVLNHPKDTRIKQNRSSCPYPTLRIDQSCMRATGKDAKY